MTKPLNRYKLKINVPEFKEMGMTSSFNSKRAFAQSSLWELIKERNPVGTLTITYAGDYKNSFVFEGFDKMKLALDAGTEKELLNEFSTN